MQATDAAGDRQPLGNGDLAGPERERATSADRAAGPDLLDLFPAAGGSARFYANLSDV